MAYRRIDISYWQDDFVLELTPEEKFFYLYIMTNSKTNQLGCYEIPKKVIMFETGYNSETIDKLLKRFIEYNKIKYSEETKEIFILNWSSYNWSNSPKVKSHIIELAKNIKNEEFKDSIDTLFIEYRYCIDTGPQEEEEEEEEEEEKKEQKQKEEKKEENIPFAEIINHLNEKTKKSYKHNTDRTKALITARFNEGYKLEDFKKVIDIKCSAWLKDEKMNIYLRPETLFSNKFEGYLNEKFKDADEEEHKKRVEAWKQRTGGL